MALSNRHNDMMWALRPDWWDIGRNYGPRAYMTILATKSLSNGWLLLPGHDHGRLQYAFSPRFAPACSPELMRGAGDLARKYGAYIQTHLGESRGELALVRELYRVPSYRPAQPWFTAAAVLARVWRWGARIKMRRGYARRRKLAAPVVSVGNLTLGGTLNLADNAGANSQGSAGVGSYKLFSYTGTASGSFTTVTGWGVGTSCARAPSAVE